MDRLLSLSSWLKGALTLALAVLLVISALPAQAAGEEASAAEHAAAWIAREYRAADSEIELFGTGILIDSLISLAAVGTEPAAARDMLEDLRGQVDDYVGSGDSFRPGAAGKVVHALHVYNEDVSTFVGRDLAAEIRNTMQTTGDETGRFGEASVLDHALAVLGLAMTEQGVPAEATAWLTASGCPNGEFTYDGTCPGPIDADTTGMVALALIAAGAEPAAVSAVEWLLDIQESDGSVPGYGTPNSNSTAAAGQAFVAAGETAAATAAATYLQSMQFPESAGLADAGGLRWLDTDVTANTFATVQGVWGLGVPPLHLVVAPTVVFFDLSGTIFAEEIEWLAAAGITRGCNPPDNDEFCPADPVTRGQMAALIERAIGLPAATSSSFTDIVGSVFVADIEAIAAAGITRGCNPPDNDRFCPDDPVTRGQMASFLRRALHLPAGAGSGFTDTAGSAYAADIEAIAAAEITRGCNPPENDRFCPNEPVTREQAAAFLYRALLP